MLVCGLVLYLRAAQPVFDEADNGLLSGGLMRMTNGLFARMGGQVARHVGPGAGAYVGGSGCALLALQSIAACRRRRFETHARYDEAPSMQERQP